MQLLGNLYCCEEGAKQFIKTHDYSWLSQIEYQLCKKKTKKKKLMCKVLFLHQIKCVVLHVWGVR